MPQLTGLGHVGIYTDDLMKQRDFYTRVIGLTVADEDLEGRVTSEDANVIQQISFKVPTIQDLRDYHQRLLAENVKVERIVSHGNAFGMYFFDPEGNRVELYYKTGLPVPQPHGEPIDLSRTDEELLGDARELLLTKTPTK